VRTDGGIKYGVDNCKPYRLAVEEPEKLITILDEFFDSDGRGLVFDGLKRAPLLNDICAVFAASPIGVGARTRQQTEYIACVAHCMYADHSQVPSRNPAARQGLRVPLGSRHNGATWALLQRADHFTRPTTLKDSRSEM
jgi:hypothetical protein